MKRVIFVLCAALALTVGVSTASAGGGNSDNAKKCQQGSYVNYSTTDGKPFKNVGDCVSYAAQGGTLVPLPDLQLVVSCTPGAGSVNCSFYVKNAGSGPATGLIEVAAALQFVPTGSPFPTAAAVVGPPDCTGLGNSAATLYDPGPPFTVIADAICDGTIPAGATADLMEVDIGGSGGSSISVTASIDPVNAIVESNENNNTFSQTFSV